MLAMLVALAGGVCAEETPDLVRNPGFEEGAAGWSLPAAYSVVEDAAHAGKGCLRLVNADKSTYVLATQKIGARPGRMYRFGAWMKTQAVAGNDSGATICMEWYGEKGYLGGAYPSGKKGDNDWYRVETTTGPIPKEATSISLALYLRKGMTGTAWFDDVTVERAYPPALDAALLKPNYRGRLAADARDQRVLVRARVGEYMEGGVQAEKTRLTCTLLRGEEKVLAREVKRPKPGDIDISLDVRRLPVGDYRVQVELFLPDGKSLARREFDLRKVPAGAPQPRVWIDEHNRTLVDGKPFFPLGWYFGPGPGDKEYLPHLDRVAATPFTTIMCYGINSGGVEKVRTYLDALAARNLKAIYSIKDVYEGTAYFGKSVLGFSGEEAIVRGVVGAFREHPAVLAWYVNDELPPAVRDRLEARYRLVKEIDPDHPTWAVLYQVDQLSEYLGTADVLGTDPYPLPSRPVTMAGDWTRKSAAISGGMRPLWQVPQAFDWGCYRKDEAEKSRAPSLDEERVMTYLCLIHGAHGLIYYSYFDLQRDRLGFEKRWSDMLVVANEVKQLEPALLSAAPAPKMEVRADQPAVEWAARADDAGNRYVLMANPDPEKAAKVRVRVPAGAVLHLLQNGKMQPLARAEVELPPMGAATLVVGK